MASQGRVSRSPFPSRASTPSSTLQLDRATLDRLKAQALEKARTLQQQAAKSTAEGVQHTKAIAQDLARSKDAKEAGAKAWVLWKRFDSGPFVQTVARMLVCLYFMNLVYENYQQWAYMRSPEMKLRLERFPDRYPKANFPYIGILLLLPCSILAGCGKWVPITASILVLDMMIDSSSLIWTQTLMLFRFGQRPNELMVKRLAMLGCSALVLGHSVKDKLKPSYAGLLMPDEKTEPGWRKSLVLLAGRLLMALLFIFVGYTQIKRVIQRDWALFSRHSSHIESWRRDGHDNNWLLLEFALALPFAVGFKTSVVSRLLALTLALEAATCWPFWAPWPTWHYAAHVRSHFVTNLGVSGGLILLQSFGAGKYTVDQLLKKKD